LAVSHDANENPVIKRIISLNIILHDTCT
jgi:hypothetical protein